MEYDWKKIKVVEEKKSSQLELIVEKETDEPILAPVEQGEVGFEYKVDLSDLFDEPTNPTYVRMFDDLIENEYSTEVTEEQVVIDQVYIDDKIQQEMVYSRIQKDEQLSRWAMFNQVELMLYHNLNTMRHDNVDY